VLASRGVSAWTILLVALGIALFVEGLPWFVAPSGMRRVVAALARQGDASLRAIGLGMMSVGLALAYLSLH